MEKETNNYIFNISTDPVKFTNALMEIAPNTVYGFMHPRYKPINEKVYAKIARKLKNAYTQLIYTDIRIKSGDNENTEYYPSFYPGIQEHFLIHSPLFVLPSKSIHIAHNPQIQLYFSHDLFIKLSNYYFPTHIPEPLFIFETNESDTNSVQNDINILNDSQSNSQSNSVLQA